MLARFSRSVIDSDGRTLSLYPARQIVRPRSDWVTAGLIAPGVQTRSGSAYSPCPRAWQLPAARLGLDDVRTGVAAGKTGPGRQRAAVRPIAATPASSRDDARGPTDFS